ncbi:hypothetical protein HQ545_02145 [Candidatus Woesearchaeota archaeon]|nr:hypothetical protein [Candidatus Woesearchaeota archaeon]
MEPHPIARMIAEKGINSSDMSMFPADKKEEIYSQAADILMRLNKMDEALTAMEMSGRPLPVDKLKNIAEDRMSLGQYKEAYALLKRIGQQEMAEFVRLNFL